MMGPSEPNGPPIPLEIAADNGLSCPRMAFEPYMVITTSMHAGQASIFLRTSRLLFATGTTVQGLASDDQQLIAAYNEE